MTTREWHFSGDVNLAYGGAFIHLDTFRNGYCDAVVVTDLDGACGFVGAVMIEHVTVNGTDDPDRIRSAVKSCGDPDADGLADLLAHLDAIRSAPRGEMAAPRDAYADWLDAADRSALLHMVVDALCSYGHRDPDGSWDGFGSSHTEILQTEPNGPMKFDGWRADRRIHNTTLEAYVRSVHLRG